MRRTYEASSPWIRHGSLGSATVGVSNAAETPSWWQEDRYSEPIVIPSAVVIPSGARNRDRPDRGAPLPG